MAAPTGDDGAMPNARCSKTRVIGVIPEILKDIEVHHTQITKLQWWPICTYAKNDV